MFDKIREEEYETAVKVHVEAHRTALDNIHNHYQNKLAQQDTFHQENARKLSETHEDMLQNVHRHYQKTHVQLEQQHALRNRECVSDITRVLKHSHASRLEEMESLLRAELAKKHTETYDRRMRHIESILRTELHESHSAHADTVREHADLRDRHDALGEEHALRLQRMETIVREDLASEHEDALYDRSELHERRMREMESMLHDERAAMKDTHASKLNELAVDHAALMAQCEQVHRAQLLTSESMLRNELDDMHMTRSKHSMEREKVHEEFKESHAVQINDMKSAHRNDLTALKHELITEHSIVLDNYRRAHRDTLDKHRQEHRAITKRALIAREKVLLKRHQDNEVNMQSAHEKIRLEHIHALQGHKKRAQEKSLMRDKMWQERCMEELTTMRNTHDKVLSKYVVALDEYKSTKRATVENHAVELENEAEVYARRTTEALARQKSSYMEEFVSLKRLKDKRVQEMEVVIQRIIASIATKYVPRDLHMKEMDALRLILEESAMSYESEIHDAKMLSTESTNMLKCYREQADNRAATIATMKRKVDDHRVRDGEVRAIREELYLARDELNEQRALTVSEGRQRDASLAETQVLRTQINRMKKTHALTVKRVQRVCDEHASREKHLRAVKKKLEGADKSHRREIIRMESMLKAAQKKHDKAISAMALTRYEENFRRFRHEVNKTKQYEYGDSSPRKKDIGIAPFMSKAEQRLRQWRRTFSPNTPP